MEVTTQDEIEAPATPLSLGTITQWGKVSAVGLAGGERYYWMIDKHGGVAMMPACAAPMRNNDEEKSNVDHKSAGAATMQRFVRRPRRIQRKRSKGWRMPAGTIYIGRPSRWGNPYTGPSAIAAFRSELEWWLSGKWCAASQTARVKEGLELLRGHDLACWCKEWDENGLRVPCHGDVLLELANR